jgi:hypothetical protein
MNGRLAKKLRKEMRRRDKEIFPELKDFINHLSFFARFRVAVRVLCGRF